MRLNLSINTNFNTTISFGQKRISKPELERLISENKTNREIAQIYGISHVYVRQLRREYGLPNERIPFDKNEAVGWAK